MKSNSFFFFPKHCRDVLKIQTKFFKEKKIVFEKLTKNLNVFEVKNYTKENLGEKKSNFQMLIF